MRLKSSVSSISNWEMAVQFLMTATEINRIRFQMRIELGMICVRRGPAQDARSPGRPPIFVSLPLADHVAA